MKRFNNKNILITGAANGIGRATAIRISSEGGNLALLDIQIDKLKNLAKELSANGSKVVYSKCNVSDFAETGRVINQLCNALGGIQGLSHNAGILKCYNTHEMTITQWNELIEVNLTGTFNVNRHALPWLLKNTTSYLVNTSSTASELPHPWLSAYSATKGAIKSFTRSLFIEYCQSGLRANSILPGGIDSELCRTFEVPAGSNPDLLKTLTPFGKPNIVDASKVSGVIAMLLSEDAYHINGTEIAIDGGKI